MWLKNQERAKDKDDGARGDQKQHDKKEQRDEN
jgi:hypothetical protein